MVARDSWVAPKTSGNRMIREKCLVSMTPLVYHLCTSCATISPVIGIFVALQARRQMRRTSLEQSLRRLKIEWLSSGRVALTCQGSPAVPELLFGQMTLLPYRTCNTYDPLSVWL